MFSLRITLIVLIAALFAAGCESEAPDEWESIPIMSGADVLTSDRDSFEYLVPAPLSEIEAFYLSRLEDTGWTYEGLGEGVGGLFLVLRREEAHLEISAYRPANADQARVVISLR